MYNRKKDALLSPLRQSPIPWLSLIVAAGWFLALAAFTDIAAAANVSLAAGRAVKSYPAVAANSRTGRFLVVWSETNSTTETASGSFDRVMGRWVDSKGQPQGSAFLISQRTSGSAALGGSRPVVAYNSVRNEFLVVYDRSYDGSAENGIFAQRISADGILIGGELTVVAASLQRIPRLAYDAGSDQYLAVWTGSAGIMGTVISGDGQSTGAITPYGPAGSTNPVLAFSAHTHSYLLVYQFSAATVAGVVAGVTIRSDGTPVLGPILISQGAAKAILPSVAWDSTLNRFLVVWSDSRDSAAVPSAYAQLVAENGDMIGGNLKLAGSTLLPRVVYSATKQRFLLIWQVGDGASAKFGYVRGRTFKADLTASGPSFDLSATKAVGMASVATVPSSAAGFAVWRASTAAGDSALLGQVVTLADALPNLSLTMAAEPVEAKVGDTITYTIGIENSGRAAAKSAVLSDKLPARLDYLSATSGQGRCALKGRTVRCTLGTLRAGTKMTVSIATLAKRAGRIANTATLTWSGVGSATSTKAAKATVTVK
jgi:uncharacterized repeat protein (TIGR01451 family)